MLTRAECRRLEPHVPAVAGLLSPTTGIVSAHGSWTSCSTRRGARREPAASGRARGPRAARPRLSARDPHPRRHRVAHERARGERGRARVGHGRRPRRASTWRRPATGSTGGRAATSRCRGQGEDRLPARVSRPPHVILGHHAMLGPRRPRALRARRRSPARPRARLRRGRGEARGLRRGGAAAACRRSRTRTSLRTSPACAQSSRAPARASATSWWPRRRRAGRPGLVNLVGIDSPGLTSAPAIADRVAALLGE